MMTSIPVAEKMSVPFHCLYLQLCSAVGPMPFLTRTNFLYKNNFVKNQCVCSPKIMLMKGIKLLCIRSKFNLKRGHISFQQKQAILVQAISLSRIMGQNYEWAAFSSHYNINLITFLLFGIHC